MNNIVKLYNAKPFSRDFWKAAILVNLAGIAVSCLMEFCNPEAEFAVRVAVSSRIVAYLIFQLILNVILFFSALVEWAENRKS